MRQRQMAVQQVCIEPAPGKFRHVALRTVPGSVDDVPSRQPLLFVQQREGRHRGTATGQIQEFSGHAFGVRLGPR